MALIVKTSNPSGLLTEIKKAIASQTIQTWTCDSDGDFTHVPDQWKHKAWMKPQVYQEELHFNFLGNTNVKTTTVIYAVFHGRFAEMLLTHFDNSFTKVEATAMPTTQDRISKGA